MIVLNPIASHRSLSSLSAQEGGERAEVRRDSVGKGQEHYMCAQREK